MDTLEERANHFRIARRVEFFITAVVIFALYRTAPLYMCLVVGALCLNTLGVLHWWALHPRRSRVTVYAWATFLLGALIALFGVVILTSTFLLSTDYNGVIRQSLAYIWPDLLTAIGTAQRFASVSAVVVTGMSLILMGVTSAILLIAPYPQLVVWSKRSIPTPEEVDIDQA